MWLVKERDVRGVFNLLNLSFESFYVICPIQYLLINFIWNYSSSFLFHPFPLFLLSVFFTSLFFFALILSFYSPPMEWGWSRRSFKYMSFFFCVILYCTSSTDMPWHINNYMWNGQRKGWINGWIHEPVSSANKTWTCFERRQLHTVLPVCSDSR